MLIQVSLASKPTRTKRALVRAVTCVCSALLIFARGHHVVPFQISASYESLATVAAHKWPLAGVPSLVLNQVGCASKLATTVCTFVRSLACMYSLMDGALEFCSECLATHITSERFLRLCEHVYASPEAMIF